MTSSTTTTTAPVFGPSSKPFTELHPLAREDASKSLAELLAANHASHHCFFNNRGMHNHSAHQLIADLTLGASPSQLTQHYQYQIKHYLGNFNLNDRQQYDPYVATSTNGKDRGGKEIEKITSENWTEHLGNARYYWSYLHFFDSLLAEDAGVKKGLKEVLETYVFSPAANEGNASMVARFYGGVLHALIHVGYGIETGVNAVVAEGLAMATATAGAHEWLFPYDWLVSAPSPKGEKVGLLELIKEVQADERLSVESLWLRDEESSLPDAPFATPDRPAFGVIQEYVDRWASVQGNQQLEGEKAMGELALFSALLLGAVPRTKEGYYKHDFFLMHLNNAHLFTPLYLDLLSDSPYRSAFLRAFLAQSLYYYVSRGRPPFTPTNFIEEYQHSPNAPDWDAMFTFATQSVDEHLPKAVRALYVYHSRHGQLQHRLLESGLLGTAPTTGENGDWTNSQGVDVFSLTASQLVRMHRGELQPSKYESEEEKGKGESVGAHQEFWSFDPFF